MCCSVGNSLDVALNRAKEQAIVAAGQELDKAKKLLRKKDNRGQICIEIVDRTIQVIKKDVEDHKVNGVGKSLKESFNHIINHRERLKTYGIFIALLTLIILPIVCAGKMPFIAYVYTQVGLSGVALLFSLYIMKRINDNFQKIGKGAQLNDPEIIQKVHFGIMDRDAKRIIAEAATPIIKEAAYRHARVDIVKALSIGDTTVKCSMIGYILLSGISILLTLMTSHGNISLNTYAALALTKASLTLLYALASYVCQRKLRECFFREYFLRI